MLFSDMEHSNCENCHVKYHPPFVIAVNCKNPNFDVIRTILDIHHYGTIRCSNGLNMGDSPKVIIE